MPAHRTEDSVLLEAVEALHFAGGNYAVAEKNTGIDRGTLRGRVKNASLRGLNGFDPVLPEFEVLRTSTNTKSGEAWVRQGPAPGEEFKVPDGQVVKGVSALVDEQGRTKLQWIKTKQGEVDPAQLIEWMKGAFADVSGPSEPIDPPDAASEELLNLYPCNDWHINMLAWEREVGSNWDLKIAEQRIGKAIAEAVHRSPQGLVGIVLGGGDLLHADNKEARTAASGHALDVDGRYQKGVETAQRLMIRTVDAVLLRNEQVIVRVLPGNHDEITSVAMTYFLKAWYRDQPRVTVDTDPSLFFYHRFGQTLLGATHGHTVKLKDMPMIMATRRAEDWGKSQFRYVHGFHVHHKEMHGWEEQGVVAEAHQAPIPQDAWHYGSGFLSGRSVQAITYHERFGEIGRARVAVLDA